MKSINSRFAIAKKYINTLILLSIICSNAAIAAPLTNGYALPMPNEFWPYNSTSLQSGTIEQQNSPTNNPDVYCQQEDYRLPAFNEYSAQYRTAAPYVHTAGLNLKNHWSAFTNNDISQPLLPNTPANTRLVGGGIIDEWGDLSKYAATTYENGNYISGWDKTEFWVTELSSYYGGVPRRYTINRQAGHFHVLPTESKGVACVFDLVPTPANKGA